MNTILIALIFFTQNLMAQAQNCAPLSVEELSFESFTTKILNKDCKVHNVEQALQLLPDEYLSHYTLVYASGSMQGSSTKDPRVILFGPRADMILTFNGDPGHMGNHRIEAMIFKNDTKQFELRDIEFPSHLNKLVEGEVRVSGPNPPVCIGCHTPSPKPFWDSQLLWTGIYGSERDFVWSTPLDQLRESQEVVWFKEYLENAKTHKRYKLLKTQALKNPNEFLSLKLAQFNFQKLAKSISDNPSLMFNLLPVLYCDMNEAEIQSQFHNVQYDPRDSINDLINNTTLRYNRSLKQRIDRSERLLNSNHNDPDFISKLQEDLTLFIDPVSIHKVARVRYALSPYQIELFNYNNEFHRRSYMFGLEDMNNLGLALKEELSTNPELYQQIKSYDFSKTQDQKRFCEKLGFKF